MTIIVAGIDVSENGLDVHAEGESRHFDNDKTGFRALNRWLHARKVMRVVMEASGRYHRALHQSLCDRGYQVVLANPLRARRFAEAKGDLAKTAGVTP